MAEQDPLIRIGWLTLSTLDDARNSTITGTVLNGPSGSGQFYWVYTSTVASADRQVRLGSSAFTPSGACSVLGILQNKPGPGEAADIGVLGVSKVICGATASISNGAMLQVSSAPVSQGGEVVVFSTSNTGAPIGFALETPTSTGAVFSAFINISGSITKSS